MVADKAETPCLVFWVAPAAPAEERPVVPESQAANLATAAAVKVVRNTMGAPAAEPERATVLRELPAIAEPLVKVATEAPATNTTLTLPALAGEVEAVAIVAAAEVVPEILTFTAADGAVEAVADPPMLSVERNTCICGKGGKIQPTTGWSSSAGSAE